MNKNIKKQLSSFISMGGNNGVIDSLLEMVEQPDEQFKAIYPAMKNKLENLFNSASFQKSVLDLFDITDTGTIDEERAAAEELINVINTDDTLITEKKEFLTLIINGSILSVLKLIEVPRERIKVEIKKLHEDAIIPQYAHKTDAGADVFAIEETTIKPHETALIKTGISVAIPVGYEIQVRPRSGLSLKTNLRVANAPGTIDSDYRGEICVIMTNIGNLSITIKKGDKIAQLVISPVPMIDWVEVEELSPTERGEGGFGSTDKA